MKIQVLSDLHIEFAPFELVSTDADLIVFAGDIGIQQMGLEWILKTVSGKPVLYVLGNHEFYGAAYPVLITKMKIAAEKTNVSIMENDRFVFGGVRFLGCTLWTDFGLLGDPWVAGMLATIHMSDYKRIRVSPANTKLRSLDSAAIHHQSYLWLREELEAPWDGPTVIITHHAPTPRAIPLQYRNEPLTAAFASDLTRLIDAYRPHAWIHGHIHVPSQFTVENTQIICNPRGYPDECSPDFDPALVLAL